MRLFWVGIKDCSPAFVGLACGLWLWVIVLLYLSIWWVFGFMAVLVFEFCLLVCYGICLTVGCLRVKSLWCSDLLKVLRVGG